MPMPFEKLRLENPTDQPIPQATYQIFRDPQGLEPALDTEDVVGAIPLPPGGVRESIPRKGPPDKELYEEVRSLLVTALLVDGHTLAAWALTTGGWESTMRDVTISVHPVDVTGPAAYQATALVWYDDDAFFEFYSAPF